MSARGVCFRVNAVFSSPFIIRVEIIPVISAPTCEIFCKTNYTLQARTRFGSQFIGNNPVNKA